MKHSFVCLRFKRLYKIKMLTTKNAPVAQLDRAPDFESGCREFESLRACHHFHVNI